MLFGNYSENNLNVFDLDLIWNGFDIYENVQLNSLKCISIFELKRFNENDFTLYLLFVSMIETV